MRTDGKWVIKLSVSLLLLAVVAGALSGGVAATPGDNVTTGGDTVDEENSSVYSATTAGSDTDGAQLMDSDDSCCDDPEVAVTVVPTGSSFASDETMTIYVGAYNDTTPVPTAVANENINVTVTRPDGTTTNYSVTTDSDGKAQVDYDLSADSQNGTYSVTVSRDGSTETATVKPDVGPAVAPAERDYEDVLTNETTDVTFLVRNGGNGSADTQLNVTITDPSGSVVDTRQVRTDADGFVNVSVTPSQQGRYEVTASLVDSGSSVSQTIDAHQVVLRTTYELGRGAENETFVYGGYLKDQNGLLQNEPVTVEIYNSSTTVENISTTTGSNGFFLVESEINSSDWYDVDVTVNGTTIRDSVDVEDPYPGSSGGGGSADVRITASAREYDVAPGSNATFDIEATENGSAIANEQVPVFVRLDYDGAPLLSTTVTTDENGAAVVDVPIPAGIDGEADIDGEVAITHNNTTATDSLYGDIQKYDFNFDFDYSAQVGSTATFGVDVTAIDGTSSVENLPIQYNALYDGNGLESYATGQLVTNQTGSATEEVYVPRTLEPYRAVVPFSQNENAREASLYYVNMFEFPGTLAIEGVSEDEFGNPVVKPGEQITLNFTTPNGSAASGIAFTEIEHNSSESYVDVSLGTDISTGSDATLTIPEYAAQDSYVWLTVWTADSQGRFYTDEVYFEIDPSADDGPIDASLTSSTDTVEAGNSFTLDATANQSVQEYRWDFDSDGTVDRTTTSSTISLVADTLGDNTITVTAVGTDGDTASATTQVTVTDTTAPTVALTGPETVVVGESVAFNASNSTDNSGIDSYAWEVTNDTGTVTTQTTDTSTTSLSFPATGNYTVSMTATDLAGNTNTTTQQVAVVAGANLETTVTVTDAQYTENVTATITVTNTGNEQVTAPFEVAYEYTGSQHASGTTASATGNLSIDTTIAGNSSIQRTVDITDWVRQNRITGDVVVTANADPDDNVSEARTEDNVDTGELTITYADLETSVSSPTAATNASETPIRAYVGNNGTANSTATSVNITVTDSSGTVVVSQTAPVEALTTAEQNLTRVTPTLEAGTYTVTAAVDDADFPAGNVSTTTITVEEYNLTAERVETPSELEVGQGTTVAFAFMPNDDAPVNATLSLDGSGLAFQNSQNDSVSTVITPDPNQPNVVTYDLEAVNTTTTPTTLNFAVTETNGSDSASLTASTNVTVVTRTVTNSTAVVHESSQETATFDVHDSGVTESHNVSISVQAGANGRTLQGLEYLVQYPYGCVEQTTSAFLGALNTDQYYRDRPNTDIDQSQQEEINGSIAEGIARLNESGIRAQQDDGSWNMWGNEDVEGDTFYSVYALYGTSEVANDPIYGPKNDESLDGVDFDQAVVWLNDEDQNADGSFSAYSYIEDEEAMTGFTIVAVNKTAQTERVDAGTRANITELQGEGVDYLLDSQNETSGAWNNGNARSTALAVHGLQVALDAGAAADAEANASEIQAAIDDGREWLVANQNSDGSWDPYHDSSYWNEAGDTSVTTAYALLALDETGMQATNQTILNGTDYLTAVYERDGSWGYPRATAISIEALDQLTGAQSSGTMTVTLDGANGTVTKTVTVNETTPRVTVSLTDSELQTLRAAGNGTTTVTVTVSDGGDSGTIIVGIESTQEIVDESEGDDS